MVDIAPPSDSAPPSVLGMLSLVVVREVLVPESLPFLGHPSAVQEGLDRLNGFTGLSNKGAFVNRSVYGPTYALPHNQSHVPVRDKFEGPPPLAFQGWASR